MKKIILILVAAVLAAFVFAQVAEKEKTYKVELTLQQWVKYSNGLTVLEHNLKNSDLPAKHVTVLMDSVIGPLRAEIGLQINRQLPKDTTKKGK